jgi:hypothetical protein
MASKNHKPAIFYHAIFGYFTHFKQRFKTLSSQWISQIAQTTILTKRSFTKFLFGAITIFTVFSVLRKSGINALVQHAFQAYLCSRS